MKRYPAMTVRPPPDMEDPQKAATYFAELHKWTEEVEWLMSGQLTGDHAPALDTFNGTILQSFDCLVVATDESVRATLEATGGGDITLVFSDGFTVLDTTPPASVILTAGTATVPQANYVYYTKADKRLTVSTTGWPTDEEHVKISYFLLQSIGLTALYGALINQNWNDHAQDANSMGHLQHISERLRRSHALYFSGIDLTVSITVNGGSADNVYVSTTAGFVYQMHKQTVAAKDMATGTVAFVVNHDTTPYTVVTDLASVLTDSAGGSMANKYFNLVIWSAANKGGEFSPLMVNVPGGSYNNQADAEGDVDGYDVFTIPAAFKAESSTGYLISRLTFRHQNASGGTWTHVSTVDLRGLTPATAAGGGVGAAQSEYADNVFRVVDNGDGTKKLAFECSGITTGNTRTKTVPDRDGTMFDGAGVNTYAEGLGAITHIQFPADQNGVIKAGVAASVRENIDFHVGDDLSSATGVIQFSQNNSVGRITLKTTSGTVKAEIFDAGIFTLQSGSGLDMRLDANAGALHLGAADGEDAIVTPPKAITLSGDTNNWNPGNPALIFLTLDTASISITGIVPEGTSGQRLTVVNVGDSARTVDFDDSSGSSSAANQILTPTGGSITLATNQSASLLYDATDSRWRLLWPNA